jgi:hypothetical protein
MIFRFVVRRFRWLARVPFLPQLFDAMLLSATAVFNRRKLYAIEKLEREACSRFNATIGNHRLGGIGFFVGKREIGHVHGNGLVDAFVGRAKRDALVQSGTALPHHAFPRSGWVSWWMRTEADVPRALQLISAGNAYRPQ